MVPEHWSWYDTEKACWVAEEVPEITIGLRLGAEQRRRQAGLQKDLASRGVYRSVEYVPSSRRSG